MMESVVRGPSFVANKQRGAAADYGLRTTDYGLKPLVMDFGLALRQEAETTLTLDGHIVGTPAYMSPEQAEGKGHQADRRSDIYSLGVVLYELLCGELPFRGSKMMMLYQVVHEEPRPPRRVNDKIPRDLETICLKAMAKAPSRRYATARELAEDLRRFLAGEPIQARPVGEVERLWRWCARNRAIASLTVSAALFLLAGAVIASYFAIQANHRAQEALREKDRADDNAFRAKEALAAEAQRRQQTREALEMLSSQVIDEWLARQKELLPEHRKFLEKAVTAYEELARDAGQEEASRAGVALAQQRVGNIRMRLGQMAKAEAAYVRSRELYHQLADDFPTVPSYRQELGRNHNNLGILLRNTGRAQDAENAFREALKLRQQLAADFPAVPGYRSDLAGIHHNLGILLQDTGQAQDAEVAYREALRVQQQLATEFPTLPVYREYLANHHNSLGILLRDTGRARDAENAFHEALKLRWQLAADFPTVPGYRSNLAGILNNLGTLLQNSGRAQDSESPHREALKLQQQLAADFPTVPAYRQELAQSYNNLGSLFQNMDRAEDAERAFREALKLGQQLAADFPTVPVYRRALAICHNGLGNILWATGRTPEAEGAFRDTMKLYQQLTTDFPNVPDYQNDLAGAMVNLANLLHRSNNVSLAQQMFEQAVPHHQAALQANPRNPLYRLYFRNNRWRFAEILLNVGAHAAAADAAAQLIQAAVDQAGDVYNAACILARCLSLAERDTQLSETQRKEQAEAYADRAIATLRQAVQNGYKDVAHMKQDSDLDSLRPRADFQKLLAELEPTAPSVRER